MNKILAVLFVFILLGSSTYAAQELTDAATINNIGYWAYEQGEWDLAQRIFAKAIEIEPTYAKALFNSAVLYNKQQNYSAAIERLEAASAVDPANAQFAYDLGVNYIEEFRQNTQAYEHFQAGLAAYERAAELDENFAQVQANLAALRNIEQVLQAQVN